MKTENKRSDNMNSGIITIIMVIVDTNVKSNTNVKTFKMIAIFNIVLVLIIQKL